MSGFKKVTDKDVGPVSVASLMSQMKLGSINLNPDYQRGSVWKKEQKAYLIDSIIRGYDIPKIYFLKQANDNSDVVDGQQRLRALREFIDDAFPLSFGEFAGKRFSQLPSKVRNSINEFELHVVELTGDRWSDEVIRDLFLRLQKGTPLNPAEKRRAYTGNVSNIVRELAAHDIFSECSQIPDSRYGYEDASAKLLYLVLYGESRGLKAGGIARMYKEYADILPTDSRIQELKKSMQLLSRAFKGKPYFKKYSLLSVVTALVELSRTYSFKDKHADLANLLVQVEESRITNDQLPASDPGRNPELALLTAAARSDRTDHLKWRKEFYAKKLLEHLNPAPLDSRRRFDKTVLAILLQNQKGKCANPECRAKISAKEAEIDHIHAYSRGGETVLSNAQLLCVSCNRSKGAE